MNNPANKHSKQYAFQKVFNPPLSLCVLCVLCGVIFLTCTRTDTLYSPNAEESARCSAFICDSLIAAPAPADSLFFVTINTVRTNSTILFAGVITPKGVRLKSTQWDFGDGTVGNKAVITHKYTTSGIYHAVLTITDPVDNQMRDTVVVHVNTPPRVDTLVQPADNASGINPKDTRGTRFEWRVSDPDTGDTAFIDFYISTDTIFLQPQIAHASGISSIDFTGNLDILKTYYWRIVATDRYGFADTGAIYSFSTRDPDAVDGTLHGYAFFQGRQDHAGIRITITAEGAVTRTATTSNTGFYEILNVTPKPQYSIVAVDEVKSEFVGDTIYNAVKVGEITFTDTLTLRDLYKPVLTTHAPRGVITVRRPEVTVDYHDLASGISAGTAVLTVNDSTMTASATVGQTGLQWVPAYRLADGKYTVQFTISDSAGNKAEPLKWTFTVDAMKLIVMQDTTVGISDTVPLRARVENVYSRIEYYRWDFNGDGRWDDTVTTNDTLHTYQHVFTDSGTYKTVLYARDDSGMVKTDTVKVTVMQDMPQVLFLSDDTIIDYGGTVRCSVYVQQQFGTMTIELDTADNGKYKNLGTIGLSGGISGSFSTAGAGSWDSVKVRVTDDDGNVVSRGFKLDIRPRQLTITSIDSSVNTITVHYSRSQESDFTEYRIYRNTLNSVDTAGELWATVSAKGTVSCKTPVPNYAWLPRYYRVYQKDSEGLWSTGSNVVYGNIINSPPATPGITYPVNDGDTIWSDEIVHWTKCFDSNGNGVRYRVLVDYNNTEYVQFRTELVDTFVKLPGGYSLSLKYKVISYDTLGDSSGWSVARSAVIKNTVSDVDGNVYNIVRIGNQLWTVENLKTTKYNDSTMIPLITENTTWSNLRTPGYCWYDNGEAAYKNSYGALYNWYTVNTGKLAPAGWHVSTDPEWTVLENYLIANGYNYDGTTTGNKIAKAMAAQTDWSSSTNAGTIGNDLTKNNRSVFSALPGGSRDGNGSFGDVGDDGCWWSATENDAAFACNRNLCNGNVNLFRYSNGKSCGFSVRLVRDY